MPARAQSKLFDTVENQIAVALQNAMNEQIYVGRARTTAASGVAVKFEPRNGPDPVGSSGGSLKIPEGTTVAFSGLVVCANATDDPATTLNYGNAYTFSGVIRNLNGTTALPVAGVPVTALDTTASHALPAGNVVVSANDTTDTLEITVTGLASKTHYWKVFLTTNAVSFFG